MSVIRSFIVAGACLALICGCEEPTKKPGPVPAPPGADGTPPRPQTGDDNPARPSQPSQGEPTQGQPTTTAQPGGEKIMTLEEPYANGTVHIRREVKLRDNVVINHGTWIEFDENGQKIGEMNYADGVLHGPITIWHPNGQKNGDGFFEKGNKEGTWEIWDDQGRKIREESYRNGVSDGMWIYWDEEGNVTHYEHWVRGERQLETKGPPPASQPATEPE